MSTKYIICVYHRYLQDFVPNAAYLFYLPYSTINGTLISLIMSTKYIVYKEVIIYDSFIDK